MKELTAGEERYIEESANGWNMIMSMITGGIDNVPDEVTKRINELSGAYVSEFKKFYSEADDTTDADAVHIKFSEKWVADHPEYTDMEKLLAGCSEEDIKRAKEFFAANTEM